MLTKKQVAEIKYHLEKAQNPLFFFDNDPDGLCSFLLLRRYLGRGKGFPIKTSPELSSEYFRKVSELNPDYIFILDKPEVSKEFFKKIEEINTPIVWIDHHKTDKKKIPKFVNYYNPLFNKQKSEEPVTTLCYQVTKVKQDIWIGVVGSIADKHFPKFYEDFKKDFPELAINSKDASEIYYGSKVGELAKIFGFGLMDRTTNVIKMLKFLSKVKGPHDVLEENSNNILLHGRFTELFKKYKKLVSRAEKEAGKSGKVFLFKYGGDISMSADIANRLSYLFSDKVIVVARVTGARVSFSIRGKKVRDKILKVIEDIPGSTGGGHEDAVGAQVSIEQLPKFEENLKKFFP